MSQVQMTLMSGLTAMGRHVKSPLFPTPCEGPGAILWIILTSTFCAKINSELFSIAIIHESVLLCFGIFAVNYS